MRTATEKKYTNYSEYLEYKVRKGILQPHNADLMKLYMDEYVASRGIADSTALVNTQYITLALGEIPDLREMSAQDVMLIVSKSRKVYKDNSLQKVIRNIHGFTEWLKNEGYSQNLNVDKVRSIKPPKKQLLSRKVTDVLTEKDIEDIISAAATSRDRAILSVMYEGGLRSVDLRKLKWKDVTFDKYGAVLHSAEKTGIPRYIRVVFSTPYLAAWKADYPGRAEGENHVFVNFRGDTTRLSYQAAKKILQKTAKKAGIQRHVHQHLLRHSRITHLLEQGVSETVVKKMMWGKVNTPMIAVYEHISEDHIDSEVLSATGINVMTDKTDPKLVAQICDRCGTINPPGKEECQNCVFPLTPDGKKAYLESENVRYEGLHAEIKEMRNQYDALFREMQRINAEQIAALRRDIGKRSLSRGGDG